MQIKDLIKYLQVMRQDAEVFVSSDEELNTLFSKFNVDYLEDSKKVVIYGLSGSEIEQ